MKILKPALLLIGSVLAGALVFLFTGEMPPQSVGNPKFTEGVEYTEITLSKGSEARRLRIPKSFQLRSRPEPLSSVELFLSFPGLQAVGPTYGDFDRKLSSVRVFIEIAGKRTTAEYTVQHAYDSAESVPEESTIEYFGGQRDGFDMYYSRPPKPATELEKNYVFKDENQNIVLINDPGTWAHATLSDRRLDGNLHVIYQFPRLTDPSLFKEIDAQIVAIVNSFIPRSS